MVEDVRWTLLISRRRLEAGARCYAAAGPRVVVPSERGTEAAWMAIPNNQPLRRLPALSAYWPPTRIEKRGVTMSRNDGTPGLLETIRLDRLANKGNPKAALLLFWFRCAGALRHRGAAWRPLYFVVAAGYKFVGEWLMGIELPPSTRVGPGLAIHHGFGLVVNPSAVIGSGVQVRHGVTIGNSGSSNDCPTVGNNVSIGAGAVLLGGITIGEGATIGANALVIADVAPGQVMVSPRAVPLVRPVGSGDRLRPSGDGERGH